MRKSALLILGIIMLVIGMVGLGEKTFERKQFYWANAYGGESFDYATAVAVTPDGEVVVAGQTRSFGAGYEDVWVIKLKANGSVKWQKTYGGKLFDSVGAIALTKDGDAIIAGDSTSFDTSAGNAWVLRLDKDGNIKWQRTYGGKYGDYARAVAVADNGDIIVAGYTLSFGAGNADVWVLRLDENGNIKWQKTYGGRDDEYATAIAITPEGDIIVVGSTFSSGAGDWDIMVLRIDKDGNVKWQKTYGGKKMDEASSVALAKNGDILVAGSTHSFGAGNKDVWILRLDRDGNVKWQKTYGGPGRDSAYAIAITPDNDIIVAGETNSFGAGNLDVWILKLNENGNVKWQKTYGGESDDWAAAIAVTPEGDTVAAGSTFNFGTVGGDFWVLKLPPDGSFPSISKDSNATITEPSIQTSNFNFEISSSDIEVAESWASVQDSNATITIVKASKNAETSTYQQTATASQS